MAYQLKATANSKLRGRSMIVIAVFSLIAIFSIIAAIYDIATEKVLLGALFGVAALLFVILALLKINTVFGTYVKVKNETLYLKSWINDFLPYDVNGGFLSDLKPAKTKLTEIPVEEISMILVGTKDFLKRNASSAGKRLVRALYPYEHTSSATKKDLISSMDIFYVETVDNECSFMCVYGFDPKAVVDIIGEIYDINPDVYVKVSSREYKRHVRQLQAQLGDTER